MNNCPTAPQAENANTCFVAPGWRERNDIAVESSEVCEGGIGSGMRGRIDVERRGRKKRYADVRMVENRFCATIICGPVNLPYIAGEEKIWSWVVLVRPSRRRLTKRRARPYSDEAFSLLLFRFLFEDG